MFHPDTYDPKQFDPDTRQLLRSVIDGFEGRGKTKLLQDDLDAAWVSEFLDFVKRERIFATFLTPSEYGIDGPNKRWDTADGYVWFVADSNHEAYELIGNVVHGQMYVSNFRLHDYPVREEDILCTGPEAFSVALNTVNVGKFNLCTASIRMCEHAVYEAITHANNRILYANPVTDFPHVRASFVDAYAVWSR